MKARKVKRLDPRAPLGDNAERIVRTRLDELCSFMPQAADPEQVAALHDMRIAAKRLRYVLEITGPALGPYAQRAIKPARDLQDLLGEIHDCDVQLPELAALLEEPVGEDVGAAVGALEVHLRARRRALFADFLKLWRDLERRGFAARLAFAASERSHSQP